VKLSAADKHHWRAAQGWLELGNHLEANEELEKIEAAARAHPDVLELRWEVYAKARQWVACFDIGQALFRLAPGRVSSWVKLGFALHELKRTAEARDFLLPATDKFPDDPTIRYNLACYACQLGQLTEARDWLAQAFKLGDATKMKLEALDDPDLAPLWDGETR
jgi:tetratricopeptide (TPR) repeat protein